MQNTKTILFAPLNWGMGHATRLVPIINRAVAEKHKVFIAANGIAKEFLQAEYPSITFLNLPEHKIRYAKKPFFNLYLLLQMPLFYFSFNKEHKALKKLISEHSISHVVSDNRYGLYSKQVHSVLITHQLFIALPYLLKCFEPGLHKITNKLVSRFNECWVPDYEDIEKSLSGKLSHGANIPKNVQFIGPLSRFSNGLTSNIKQPTFSVVALISGPEPYRTVFENSIIEEYSKKEETLLIVCGKPQNTGGFKKVQSNITTSPHLNSASLLYYLQHARTIIARSGYSTIMDFHVLGLEAKFYPTPGQSEQEYLAEWYKKSRLI